jgi:cytokinin dehydrogenase
MIINAGTGEMVTCSRDVNSDLFFAALGGLGQFGVITRARIRLAPAPKRVRWVRLAYSDVATFTKDQELLISNRTGLIGFDYVEGQVQLNRSFIEGPKSTPFFSGTDLARLARLASRTGSVAIYYIEAAMYYTEDNAMSMDKVQISSNTKVEYNFIVISMIKHRPIALDERKLIRCCY